MRKPAPTRGDVWLADLGTTRGHEHAGRRPILVLSTNPYNRGPAGLVIALPLTSVRRAVPTQVIIDPPEGGLKSPSAIICDGVRSLAKDRLLRKWGVVAPATLRVVEDQLRILMEL